MKSLHRALALVLLAPTGWLSPNFGQQEHRHPAPTTLGEVSFPVSCSPAVQNPFNKAVALLHSFSYSAAENKFREIAREDPHCAMAHWGVAMSYYHQMWEPPITPAGLERGQSEIRQAQLLGGASPREKGFIDALALFYSDSSRVPHATRALAYEKAMAAVASENPDDPESRTFYALALVSTAPPTDRNHTNQKLAAGILEPLFKRFPQHPGVAHYLIHAYDNPELARQGLPAARAYAKIAPSAPHALHMPSHIFTQLGLWPDSIRSNLAARAAARREGDIGEELHSMDYLMYADLQAGRLADAARLLQELRAMPELPVSEFKVGYAATAMPVRYALERSRWEEAQAIPPRPGSPPQVLAITHWARTLGLARGGKPEAAAPEIKSLEQCLRQVQSHKDDYWAAQVDIQIDEARAWVAHASGRQEEAVALLRAAAENEDRLEKRPITPGPIVPAREQLGDLLRELNRPAEALHEFETSLAKAPRRRSGLAGAASAAELSGDRAKAGQFKSELSALNEDDGD